MGRQVQQVKFPPSAPKRKRVAAYARVSCGKDSMLHSLASQVEYYSNYIRHHPGWEYVGVYADEAKTGTRDSREQFQRMLADCRSGKIDHIVTKSISRLARNTITLLETVRELKSLGISVYFEEQNIDTATADGELMLSILASYAQEESLSTSENMKWRIHSNFQNGLAWNPTLLGYRYEQGSYIIEPTEADTVRLIFDSYLQGMGAIAIANMLNESSRTSRFGNGWGQRSIMLILQNYTYTGNLLLQKKYTVDFLTKTMKVNQGEVPQYYMENSHPAIIKPAEWEAVQVEMEQRRSKGKRHDCKSPFSGMIFCGDCGGVYGSKVWHSNDPYRRVIWRCNHKYNNSGEKCGTPHIREEVLKERFRQALSEYFADPEERLEGLRYVMKAMTDTDFIDADIDQAEQDLQLLSGMIRSCIMMNTSAVMTEQEYRQQHTELTRQYEAKKAEYDALLEERKKMDTTAIIFSGILFELGELDEIPADFKESLWHTLVDRVTVYADERIVFSFKDDTEVTTML